MGKVGNCSTMMRNAEGHSYLCIYTSMHAMQAAASIASKPAEILPHTHLCFIPSAEKVDFTCFSIHSAPNHFYISLQEMRTSESVNCRDKTLVLVGKTGNGKSATGNSIIGRKVFDSEFSLAGVTSMCQLETTKLDDGQILNVIDTPGLLDSSVKAHVIAKEIARCITLAKDGIHSLILVLSIGNRFADDEVSVFHGLRQIFGPKIDDYMIVVFCHGDVVPENQCLDDVLSRACPDELQRTLEMCGNRCVLFDNKTKDEAKISRQREELISIVNDVVDNNDGMPYTNDLFDDQLKNGDWNLIDPEISDKGQERFERLIVMVESRLREGMERLEKQLEEERAARQKAEAMAQLAESRSKEEMHKLAASLERAQLEAEARERAAREEAETKAREAEKNSKEEREKLAGLLENARLEAEARERASREEAEARAQSAEASSKEIQKLAALLEKARLEAEARETAAREEAEAKAQEAEKNLKEEREKLAAMLERSRSEAEAKMEHLNWEIQNIRNHKDCSIL